MTTAQLAGVVLFLALLPHLLLLGSPYTTNAAAAYLVDGVRLYHGGAPGGQIPGPPQAGTPPDGLPIFPLQTPGWTLHGPLFSFLLFAVFKLFGVSIIGPILLVKICFVGSIMAFFFLINELFGRWIAFFSALLVMSSRTIYFHIGRHIYLDALVVVLEMLFLFLYVRAWKEDRAGLFMGAGFVLGLAFLTKENALFFLLLPIVASAFLRSFNKTYMRHLVMLYGAFALTVLPWTVFLSMHGHNVTTVLGWFAHPYQSNTTSLEWHGFLEGKTLWQFLWENNPLFAVWHLFLDRIAPLEIFGRLYLVTITLVMVKGLVFRKNEDLLFFLMLLCASPLVFAAAIFGDRLGHLPEFLYLMHVTLPVAVLWLRDLFFRRQEVFDSPERASGRTSQVKKWAGALVAVGLVILLIPSRPDALPDLGFGTATTRSWFGEEVVGNIKKSIHDLRSWKPPFFGGDIRQVGGRHSRNLELAVVWLQEHMPDRGVIITESRCDDAVRFYTEMRWPVVAALYPRFIPMGLFVNYDPLAKGLSHVDLLEKKGKVLFVVDTPSKFRSKYYRHRSLLVIFEDDVHRWRDVIFQDDAYILLNQESEYRVEQLDAFLLYGPHFKQVHKADKVRISQKSAAIGHEPDLSTIKSAMSPHVIEDLKWLKNEYPNEFALFVKVLERSNSVELLDQVKREIQAES